MHRLIRHGFVAKAIMAAALIGLADLFFFERGYGATLGVFALAWAGGLALVRADVRRHAAPRSALLAAAGFALVLVDDPSVLGWGLFWIAIASASLLPRHRFGQAAVWGVRLAGHGILGIVTPLRDLHRLVTARRGPDATRIGAVLAVLVLPIVGGGVFLALFASANPLIGNAFDRMRLPDLSEAFGHAAFCTIVLLAIWPNLRPRSTMPWIAPGATDGLPGVPPVPLGTLTLSLLTFNAIFAVENALDLAYLWSGAALPAGVTLADYAHRGAYPLIVTALLAGVFVLLAARPGSDGAASVTVRRLLVLWIAQNILLVASSVLRTLDYIDAYSLTRLRIAALLWMALVATGLALIGWRMVRGRSSRWLINANAIAAGTVLTLASMVDLGGVAADWNVRHARAASDLDLCYIGDLGASSLLPLIALERRAGGPMLRDRVAFLRARTMVQVTRDQGDWHGWTWRNARRLSAARDLLGPAPRVARAVPGGRECDGTPLPPPPPAPAPPAPAAAALTKAPRS